MSTSELQLVHICWQNSRFIGMPILCIRMERLVKVITLDFLHNYTYWYVHSNTQNMFTLFLHNQWNIPCHCVWYTTRQNTFCMWILFHKTTVYIWGSTLCRTGLYPSLLLYLKFITAVQSQNAPLLSGTADCCGQKHWEGGGDKVHVCRSFPS